MIYKARSGTTEQVAARTGGGHLPSGATPFVAVFAFAWAAAARTNPPRGSSRCSPGPSSWPGNRRSPRDATARPSPRSCPSSSGGSAPSRNGRRLPWVAHVCRPFLLGGSVPPAMALLARPADGQLQPVGQRPSAERRRAAPGLPRPRTWAAGQGAAGMSALE